MDQNDLIGILSGFYRAAPLRPLCTGIGNGMLGSSQPTNYVSAALAPPCHPLCCLTVRGNELQMRLALYQIRCKF